MSIENTFFNALSRQNIRHEEILLEIKELLKLQEVLRAVSDLKDEVLKLKQEIKKMADELDALATQVQDNTDAEQSAITLLGQLHDLLVAAGTDPNKLNDLKNQLAASKEKLAAAIVANTPAASTPPTP